MTVCPPFVAMMLPDVQVVHACRVCVIQPCCLSLAPLGRDTSPSQGTPQEIERAVVRGP